MFTLLFKADSGNKLYYLRQCVIIFYVKFYIRQFSLFFILSHTFFASNLFDRRCLALNGLRIPRQRPKLMTHICRIDAEQAKTSLVTYTLHHATPRGQYPANITTHTISHSFKNFMSQKLHAVWSTIYMLIYNMQAQPSQCEDLLFFPYKHPINYYIKFDGSCHMPCITLHII